MVPRGEIAVKNPLVSAYVCTDYSELRLVLQLRNFSLIYGRLEGIYSKLWVEIRTPEVDIYMKNISFFVIFSKTVPTIFFSFKLVDLSSVMS